VIPAHVAAAILRKRLAFCSRAYHLSSLEESTEGAAERKEAVNSANYTCSILARRYENLQVIVLNQREKKNYDQA
jgi:hypothetical protein